MFASTIKQKLKLTMVTVPFYGHYKILAKWGEEIKKTNPDIEITMIITGWKNVNLTQTEIEKLKSCGIKIIILNDEKDIQSSAPMDFTFPRAIKLTDSVIENAKGSDYIIYDFFSPEGFIAGKQLHIPVICSVPAILGNFNKHNILFQQSLEQNKEYFELLEKKYHIDLINHLEMVSDGFFIPSDFNNIIWTWPGLMNEKKYQEERKNTENYVFMRPEMNNDMNEHSILKKIKNLKLKNKKIIYFSLGTVVTKNLWDHEDSVKHFVNNIFEILLKNYANHPDYEFIISTGRPIKELNVLNITPKNFHIYESIPQSELLQDCDLFITHAGGNSMNEAIHTNTPMIAIPFFGDQHICAEYISNAKIGISFLHEEKNRELVINTQSKLFSRPSFTEKNFVAAIETILHNDTYNKAIKKIKNIQPTSSIQLIKALQNWKILNWQEGDLLYGCSQDRRKLAEIALKQHYFRIGDKRPFSILFPNPEKQNMLPRIVDQYHDVIKYPSTLSKELTETQSEAYKKILKEYHAFLSKNPKYLEPLGRIDQHENDNDDLRLKTLWNICLGGLEFFATLKNKTIHFVIGMFNDKLSDATVKELQWVKQHWHDRNVQQHIKFYVLNNGLLKQVDPVKMHWFSKIRPTPSLVDVAPEKLNHKIWDQFKKELQEKSAQINPHGFFNQSTQLLTAKTVSSSLEISASAYRKTIPPDSEKDEFSTHTPNVPFCKIGQP